MKQNNLVYNIILLLLIFVLLSQCNSVKENTSSTSRLHDSITVAKHTGAKVKVKAKPPEFPEFPLPPPNPSALEDLSNRFINIASKLEDVNNILISALEQNGYSRRSYFSVPDGFAMVTQLESIDEHGFSIPDPNRWITENKEYRTKRFTVSDYISSLFKAKPGYYRCIVFIITTDYYSFSPVTPTETVTKNWLSTGVIKLPKEVGEMNFNNDYTIMALIYEFKKLENEDNAIVVTPSSNSGKTHLTNSGILSALTK